MNQEKTTVQTKLSTLVNEMWGLVGQSSRGSGKPVFSTRDALRSHLTKAFHKGLISGQQAGRKSTIWLDKDAAMSHVIDYAEACKNADYVSGYTLKRLGHNNDGRSNGGRSNGGRSVVEQEEVTEFRYIIIDPDGDVVCACGDKHKSKAEAALSLVERWGLVFYRVDGSKLTKA